MKVYSRILIFFLLICLGQEAFSNSIRITNFRFSLQPTSVRLVFDATGKINYTVTASANKIIVDIKKAKLIAILNKTGLAKTPVSSILNKQKDSGLQLILNLKNPIKLRHFLLTKPDRLILDLYPIEKEKSNADVIIKPAEPSPADTSNDPEQELIDKMNQNIEESGGSSRDIIVVIDPGHGGEDSGTVGHNGTREKDVTLAVAKALQNIINKTKGFRAVLTRNSDYFISLRKRLGIAHSRKADMFVSIHADAYKNTEVHGVSIFALSQRGATSEAARWLAEKENESELGQAISDKNTLLRSVLIDLAQTATISASLEIGGIMLQSLADITSLHLKYVEQAGFVVLKSPDIPSLLVEVGFLSHRDEEFKLRSAAHQKEIAAKLAIGIESYFVRRPPQGTYLAKIKRKAKFSGFALGDSLPSGDV